MCVAARNYQGEHGEAKITISLLPFFQQHCMNVAFKVVHRNQWLIQRKGQRFRIADPDQQRSRESRSLGYGERIDRLVALSGVYERLTRNRNNRAQMLAR